MEQGLRQAGAPAGPGRDEEHPQKPLFLTSLPVLNWLNCRRRCCQSQWVPGNGVRTWASPNYTPERFSLDIERNMRPCLASILVLTPSRLIESV